MILAGAGIVGSQETPEEFTVTVSQIGLNVVWSGSGSFNFTDLTFSSSGTTSPGFNANQAIWAIGPSGSFDSYSGASLTYPTTMGSGVVGTPPSGSGDVVGVLLGGLGRVIAVPSGYISGSPLTSSATYTNTTISGLGLTAGTYTWAWGSGANASSLVMTIS